MFVGDEAEVERIEQKLLAAIDHETDSFADVLNAIVHVLTFHMALACPGCRKSIARSLRKRVPQILSDANQIAASAGPREHMHLQ